jgi:phosphoribosylformimino-5-aminoimidazole carboxamide ribotide isomerase
VHLDEFGTPWPRTHGWTREAGRDLWRLLAFLSGQGLRHVLCTDIGRDGAMTGPNVELYRAIAERHPELEVQASGGVSGLRDLGELAGSGAASAITGKALLEGAFSVAEAVEYLG